MATVEYHKVGKSFGPVEVLHNLSLDIERGSFVVLLGASGCGKTTLLRMTAGLETISAGEIKIDGKVVNNVHPRDRDIAMVFQNYALYPTMKVRDNIGFSLEVAKKSKAEINQRVEEAAKVLNLSELLDRKPSELSGGQRQRVAMGRAMVRDAKVFLFDEPLSNLDAKLRAHMRVEIRQLHDRLKATTVYVTHDQIEAMTMADKIVLMKDGNIVQEGSPDDLYDRPNCRYVAEFIGTPQINFLSGEIISDGGQAQFRADGTDLPLVEGYAAHAGRKVTCGVRPNDVRVDPDGHIKGRLQIAEKTGADIQFHLDIDGSEFVAVAPRATFAPVGEEIAFSMSAEKMHIFDEASGERIEV
ncbi:MAG: sn-glycerol-3-phosphate ABC transporter ATP-binding protein UgpC [Crocosphaera sp.]|nr:sn-glycerol-3-phosphate ABC transporter ATP-binding protein UgpC [Crocosphaera sp.]MDJ0685791.1 sn-glycerol-3-phosphate ABC transporter ATP-binding protein UgpC [Alphaproteobacteria bacterium]